MNNWTEKEKAIADAILKTYLDRAISYDEAVEYSERFGINSWDYRHYAFNEAIRRYNQDFNKYIGKMKEEALEDKIKLSDEDIRLLRDNPYNITLEKTIRDDLQRRQDIYEINQAKYYYGVAIDMMKSGFDDEYIKQHLPLNDNAVREISEEFATYGKSTGENLSED